MAKVKTIWKDTEYNLLKLMASALEVTTAEEAVDYLYQIEWYSKQLTKASKHLKSQFPHDGVYDSPDGHRVEVKTVVAYPLDTDKVKQTLSDLGLPIPKKETPRTTVKVVK